MCVYHYMLDGCAWGDVQSAQILMQSYTTLLLWCLLRLLCFALFVVNVLFPAFVLVFYSKMLHCSKTSGCRIHHLEIRCLANSQQMLSKPWHRATSSGKARNLILGHNCNGLIRWKSRDSEPYVGALKTHAINEPTAPVAVCFNLFSARNTF